VNLGPRLSQARAVTGILHGNRAFGKALALNRRKTPVSGCVCDSCPHYTANLRVYKALHPVGWRSALKYTGDRRWPG
jgi:hypothetical protein